MDKKKLIAVVGAIVLSVLGLVLGEDVKELVCGPEVAKVE